MIKQNKNLNFQRVFAQFGTILIIKHSLEITLLSKEVKWCICCLIIDRICTFKNAIFTNETPF